ncbi:hypothetical protein D9757_000973 [Collybiopsis confluens]|uniref:Aquaporin n=1 Tax=Collybiopsis confluens TaxID=2823264 RepID=A0A8H5I0U0_9AGAR|nr:hypothetical protein D9757_000973 [Collybiopsis confluens]
MTSPTSTASASHSRLAHNKPQADLRHPHFHHEIHHPIAQPDTYEPNRLGTYREYMKVYVAEFAGTMILVIFGLGANCQVSLSTNTNVSPTPKGSYTSVGFGFAVGISLGVWVSGKISGGHINPAVGRIPPISRLKPLENISQVTLAMATFRDFPWKKVPGYVFAQLMGGLVGAAIVYANYFHAINVYEGGSGVRTLSTAGNFGTYPLDYMTNVSSFFSEFLGAAILVFVVFMVTDPGNGIPSSVVPMVLFVVLLGIAISLGMETGFAINPARDLGPRLLTAMVGYGGKVFSFRNQYWLWAGVIAPILGGITGACFYDIMFASSDVWNANHRFGRMSVSFFQ